MALNFKDARLRKPLTFKRLGSAKTKTCKPGKRVRYTRSPAEPGLFVLFTDVTLRWYAKVDAINLQHTLTNGKEAP